MRSLGLPRLGRWLLLMGWCLSMDDGCAALEAAREARQASARPVHELPLRRPTPFLEGGRDS